MKSPPNPRPTNATGVVIDIQDVSKVYATPSGPFSALSHVGFQARAGDLLAVVGKSGSGKSTLLNVMTGIDRPTHGQVNVAGTAVHALREGPLAAWRGRHVGVVFQFFQLLPNLTVVENVMLPMEFCNTFPPRERRGRALSLLARVGIEDQADKLPLALSGGQQQRAAIARALANDPPLVVADEPTGNLDSRTSADVWTLLSGLARTGKTVVVVTHDPDVTRWVNRVITLCDGVIQSDQQGSRDARGAEVAHA